MSDRDLFSGDEDRAHREAQFVGVEVHRRCPLPATETCALVGEQSVSPGGQPVDARYVAANRKPVVPMTSTRVTNPIHLGGNMRKSVLTVLALVVVAVTVAVAGSARAASARAAYPTITGLTYTPKAVYDDESSVGIVFRVNQTAPPGYEYGVIMGIIGKYAVPGYCSSIAMSWDRKFGGDSSHIIYPGKHWKLLKGTRYGYWCRGEATVWVVRHKIGSSGAGRPLASTHFRIAAAP